jgi:hypothetical protein
MGVAKMIAHNARDQTHIQTSSLSLEKPTGALTTDDRVWHQIDSCVFCGKTERKIMIAVGENASIREKEKGLIRRAFCIYGLSVPMREHHIN